MLHSALTFGKNKRLLTAKEYKQVFESPIKKIHSQHLLMFVAKNQTAFARLGLAITKKKLKNATQRNHLKRQVRERFRLIWQQLDGVDVVVIVKSSYDKTNEALIKTELDMMFYKLTASHSKQT